MMRLLPAMDNAGGWRRLFLLAVAAMLAIHVFDIFVRPWLAGMGDVVIHDDARQFLTWTARLLDPGALPGDWMADFWQDVSPPAYQAVYRTGAWFGIGPADLARLLSVAMLALAGVAAWRLATALTARPAVAFVAAGFLMAFLSKEDAIFSATPRGLAVPAVLFFMEALVRQRWTGMVVAGAALALLYPAPAATLFTMLALSRVDWSRVPWPSGGRLREKWTQARRSFPCLVGGWGDVARLLGFGALLAVLVLAFREQSNGWGPALTMEQARTMPVLMTPGARSTIVNESGAIDYLCSMRMGFLPEIVPCGRGVPLAWLGNLLFLTPLLWLAWRGIRRGGPERLYALALAAALLWFVAASLAAFHLHLPSRFSQRVLYPLEWLAIGQVIGEWLARGPLDRGRKVGIGAVAVFLAVTFATPLAMLQTPSDRGIIDEARAMPAGVRIGGVSDDLQFIPALAGRAITASPQHAIPWQTGYFEQVEAGLAEGLIMVSTDDPDLLAATLMRSQADHLLMSEAVLRRGELTTDYARALPERARAAEEAMSRGTPVLRELAPLCTSPGSAYISVPCLLQRLSARDDVD